MAPSEPSPDSARQQATVLYADIAGFTALSEKLDPEDVTTVMNAVFERLEAVVVARGGVVNKYIGDSVMAVFGLVPGSPSPARQAVLAALEMRAAVQQYNDDAGCPTRLDVHIGVNSGPVVAGEIGGTVRREFTVMGDTVRLAAGLEEAAQGGQIFVGPRTYEETAEHFEYRAASSLPGRNGTDPVPVRELLAAKPAPRRAKRPSERRQATVVFVDVTGFEALGERLAPDELTLLLNRCFAELESIVRTHGGVVDKYIGGCLMALFGVPNAIEDAPGQAINAAIEIRNRLGQLKLEGALPEQLDVRMGVNTGLVVAGEIGGRVKRDFTVMGDTVNVAARLREVAGHGVIYVAPETYRYTKDAFEYRPLQALRLAGKEHPLPMYELASVTRRVHRGKATRSDGTLASALVGRDGELQQLQKRFARVIAGEGGTVNVVGEAGLGKSRLIAEALRFAPLRDATVLEGRSTAIGRALSYHPFIDLLRHWAAIADDDAEPEAFAKLADAVAAVMPGEVGEVLPFVATLLGMRPRGPYAERLEGIADEALESLITKNTRELFLRLAEIRPLVLVFEDLHWADASSLKLLEVLVRLAGERPVLFVHVFRPDHEGAADGALERALAVDPTRHTQIRIAPLDAEQSGTLVRNLLAIDDLPRATRDLIARTSDGNPFYIEEIVRSLIDEGAIEYVDGTFRVTAKIASVVVPGTIQEVIMTRVDRLDEPTRNLLRIASVIGRNFYHRIIAEVARRQGETDEELYEELQRLQQKELLLQRGDRFGVAVSDRTVGQELEYVFAHALAQETVYNSILRETRKEFHQVVAESIESLFAERLGEFHGMLGHHYGRADDLPNAEEHLFKAGEAAARSAASAEALAHFTEAARIYERLHGDGGDPRRKALLEKHIGHALLNVGRLTESIAYFDRALEHNGYRIAKSALATNLQFVLDLPAVLFRLLVRPQSTMPVSDEEREAFEIMSKRFRAMTTSDPKRMFFDNLGAIRRMNQRDPGTIRSACLTYVVGGAAFAYSGTSFAISRLFLRRAQELVRPGEVSDELGCGFFRFVVNFLEGRWREEPGLAPDLLERGLKNGIVWEVDSYLGLECDRRLRQGRFGDAREQLRQLTELSERYGYEFAQVNADVMQAILLIETRALGAGLDAAERYYAGRDTDTLRVLALGTMAKAQTLLDRPADAQDSLSRAAAILRQPGIMIPPWHLSAYTAARLRHATTMLECAAAPAARSLGALRSEVRKSARHALRVANVVAGARPETWRLVGRAHWLLGRPKAAFAWWRRAAREAERLDATVELARIHAESAVRASARPVPRVDVPGRVERACAMFSRAGLVGDLAHLEDGLRPGGESAARHL